MFISHTRTRRGSHDFLGGAHLGSGRVEPTASLGRPSPRDSPPTDTTTSGPFCAWLFSLPSSRLPHVFPSSVRYRHERGLRAGLLIIGSSTECLAIRLLPAADRHVESDCKSCAAWCELFPSSGICPGLALIKHRPNQSSRAIRRLSDPYHRMLPPKQHFQKILGHPFVDLLRTREGGFGVAQSSLASSNSGCIVQLITVVTTGIKITAANAVNA